jgi:preprotein translocase subunit SecF
MEFLSKTTHIDFMGKRKIGAILSAVLMVVSLGSLATRGLNFGIEFTGGVVIEAGFPDTADLTAIRAGLGQAGFPEAIVQNFGSSRDVVIQMDAGGDRVGGEVRDQVMEVLRAQDAASSSWVPRSARNWRRPAGSRPSSRC